MVKWKTVSNLMNILVSDTIQNEINEQKGEFLSMLFLVCLSRKMLTGKGFIRARYGFKRKGIIRAGYRCSIKDFLFHLILEIQEYHQNEPRSSGVYSRNNLPNKIKDGAYIIDLD